MSAPRRTPRNPTGGVASTSPMYARVANDLMNQIVTGAYPVGSLLPKEVELSARYGVSRHTMREALRQLRDAGLVSRRRRAGTEVIAATRSISYRQPINSVNDLLQYGEGTQVRVVQQSRLACDAALAQMLECEQRREWLCVETVRTYPNDPRPICLTKNYLNVDLLDVEEIVDNLSGPISAMLERRYGVKITSIEQSIQAVPLKEDEAKLLLAEQGSPALRSIRRYYDETSRLLELSNAIHPGDRFTYVMHIQRE